MTAENLRGFIAAVISNEFMRVGHVSRDDIDCCMVSSQSFRAFAIVSLIKCIKSRRSPAESPAESLMLKHVGRRGQQDVA